MLRNYIIIALRNLNRYRTFSFLNISGLSVGLAASILILLWVRNELSYDRFHKAAKQIYRVTAEFDGLKVAVTPPPLSVALKDGLPEVENTTRIAFSTKVFSFGEKSFEEKRVYFVEPSFFQIFDFTLSKGDITTALKEPNGLLLTEQMALKYFGKEDPVGKTILLDKEYGFIVKGVLRNVPANSHLQYDFLLPMVFLVNQLEYKQNYNWTSYTNTYTYIQLKQQIKDNTIAFNRLTKNINQIYTSSEKKMKAGFALQPLLDIHLKSGTQLVDLAGHGDIQQVRILSLVALCILTVAAINFMNLATARAGRRAKEVGMRKALGANSGQLVSQFLGESMIISVIAFIFSLIIVLGVLPAFNELTEKNLSLSFLEADLLIAIIVIVLMTGILAGSYPALYLATFKPIESLKGTFKAGSKSIWLRNGLVVVQFIVTIVMVVATIIIYQQIEFIRQQNLGFNKENLLYVPIKKDIIPQYRALRIALEASNVMDKFTISSELLTNMSSGTTSVDWEGKNIMEQPVFPLLSIDQNFIKTMGMKLVAGRSFSQDFTADSSNFLVNQKALKVMNIDQLNAIGKSLTVNGVRGKIIGVVEDFHFKPLGQVIEPLIMQSTFVGGFVLVRTKPEQIQYTLQELQSIFGRLNSVYPFEYNFLDQDYSTLYRTEQRTGKLSGAFSSLAIFIACLGIFGLSAFMAQQRKREIAVRKVLGASVGSIMILLSKDLFVLVIFSLALATPLTWYLMSQWLENYAYSITINGWLFILAGVCTLLIALFTTGFETLKAALTNPVKTLRNE